MLKFSNERDLAVPDKNFNDHEKEKEKGKYVKYKKKERLIPSGNTRRVRVRAFRGMQASTRLQGPGWHFKCWLLSTSNSTALRRSERAW